MEHRFLDDSAVAQVLEDDALESAGVTPAYQMPSG